MTATIISDLALLTGAIGFLVISGAGWLLVWRRGVKTITAQMGDAKLTIDAKLDHAAERMDHAVHQIEEVNKAVNNVSATTPTIPDRLATLEAKQDWMMQHLPDVPPFPPMLPHH